MSHSTPTLWLIRHGETAWSVTGQHTGRTDLSLSEAGREQARQLGRELDGVRFAHLVSSPLKRARETLALCGAAQDGVEARVDPDLAEWDYGAYEGLTSVEIRAQRPDWDLWTQGAPGGESPEAISARVDRALERLRVLSGDVAVFAHGHLLRVLALRYLGWPLPMGAQLALETTSVLRLAIVASHPSILAWRRPR